MRPGRPGQTRWARGVRRGRPAPYPRVMTSATSPVPPRAARAHSVTRAVIGGYTGVGRRGVELWAVHDDDDDRAPRSAGTPENDGARWSLASSAEFAQPSWLVDLGAGSYLAVGESDASTLAHVRLTAAAELEVDGVTTLSGAGACHAAVAGEFAVVAHYVSGSVSSVRLDPAGRPIAEVDHVTFAGSGPDPERQASPHAHQVVIEREEVLVCDLGADRVHRLRLTADGRLREGRPAIALPPGFGPRHLVRSGPYLVIAGELSNELWLGRLEGDLVEELDLVSLGDQSLGDESLGDQSLGDESLGAAAESYPSALRLDDDGLVWTAVRGPDTVVVHRLAGASLEPVAQARTGGSWPRDVVVVGQDVWVTNERSDDVTILDRAAVLDGAADAVRARIPAVAPTCVIPGA